MVALLSDRFKVRGIIILCVIPIAIAGYAVIANVKQPETRFAMTCLMALGMYCAVPPVLVWNANNSAGHYKRATTSGLQLAIANAGGFVASMTYLMFCLTKSLTNCYSSICLPGFARTLLS